MAKPRKTVSIESLLQYANGYLSSDYDGGDDAVSIARRTGVINLLEAALNAADRYHGFSYLDDKVVTKSKPGIRWLEVGHSFENTDPTRRRYA
jgi:hypothetical protein